MRLDLFFKDSMYGHVSRDRPRAGWTRVTLLKGSKTDHYRCPLCSLFLAGGWERVLGNYEFPRTERKWAQLLKFSLELPVSHLFLSFSGVLL